MGLRRPRTGHVGRPLRCPACTQGRKLPQTHGALLSNHGLACCAISAHLVGQAGCDPLDGRHQTVAPPEVWGDGDPAGGAQPGHQTREETARAAAACEHASAFSPRRRGSAVALFVASKQRHSGLPRHPREPSRKLHAHHASPRLQCGVAGGERLVDVHHSIRGLGDVGGVVLDGAAHDADNSSNGSAQPAEASTSVYTVARDAAAQSRCGGDDVSLSTPLRLGRELPVSSCLRRAHPERFRRRDDGSALSGKCAGPGA